MGFPLNISLVVPDIYGYRIAGIFRGYKLSRFSRIGSHPRNFIPPKICPSSPQQTAQWTWCSSAAALGSEAREVWFSLRFKVH